MQENKFELGPIQKAWIAALRKYPERQMTGSLGLKHHTGRISACCLGQGGLIAHEMTGVGCYFGNDGILREYGEYPDNEGSQEFLEDTYHILGLRNAKGNFTELMLFSNGCKYSCLSDANDLGISWPEIADFIEANPEKVFTKSV